MSKLNITERATLAGLPLTKYFQLERATILPKHTQPPKYLLSDIHKCLSGVPASRKVLQRDNKLRGYIETATTKTRNQLQQQTIKIKSGVIYQMAWSK